MGTALGASVLVLLAGCGGAGGDGSSSSTGGGQSKPVSEPGEQAVEIADGTYVAVNLTENRNERASVIVLDGDSVTQTYSDCWYGVTTTSGTRSGEEIAWDGGGDLPGTMVARIDDEDVVGFHLTGTGSIAYLEEFFPEDSHSLAGDLAEFNQRCDFPIPEA